MSGGTQRGGRGCERGRKSGRIVRRRANRCRRTKRSGGWNGNVGRGFRRGWYTRRVQRGDSYGRSVDSGGRRDGRGADRSEKSAGASRDRGGRARVRRCDARMIDNDRSEFGSYGRGDGELLERGRGVGTRVRGSGRVRRTRGARATLRALSCYMAWLATLIAHLGLGTLGSEVAYFLAIMATRG